MRSRIAALGVVLLLVAGCGTGGEPAASSSSDGGPSYPMTITNCGRQVTFEKAPQKVLTVGSTAPNLLYAADAGDRIAGRSGEFGIPPYGEAGTELAKVPVVTPDDPSLEQVLGSGADVVIGSGLFKTTTEDVEKSGLISLMISGECSHDAGSGDAAQSNIDGIWADIELYGTLFGDPEKATRTVDGLKKRLDAAKQKAAGAPKVTAAGVYFWGTTPSVTGARNVLHEQLSLLGVTDVFADVEKNYVESNTEELIGRNPDVIVLSYGLDGETAEAAKKKLLAIPGIDAVTAVRQDKIILYPYALRSTDPAAVEGVETLATAFGRG